MSQRILWVLFIGLCIPLTTQAASDLLEAYAAAQRNDPVLQAARYKYEGAREAIPQARARRLPQVSLDAQVGRTDQDVLSREQVNIFDPDLGLGRSRFKTSAFSFSVAQPIFRYGNWVGYSQSKAAVRQAYAEYLAAEQDLMRRCAEVYLGVLSAKDDLRLARAERASAERQMAVVQARRQGGLATITEDYEARARVALVEADIALAIDMLDDSRQQMREIMGDAVRDVRKLRDDFPLVSPEPQDASIWIDRALDANLAIMAAHEMVAVAEHEVRKRVADRYPTIDLVARHGNSDTKDQVSGADVDSTVVSLQVTVPILSGGYISSKTREANLEYRRALAERTALHRSVRRETRAAYRGVITAIARVEALGTSVTSQQSAVEGKRKGYRSGVNRLVEVLDAERDLYSTMRDFAQARYEYLMNMIRLKQQTGALSIEDLEYINSLLAEFDP